MKAEDLLKGIEEVIIREIPADDSTSREEKLILMEAILKHRPKVIVETGTHKGLTTCYMGLSAKEVGAVIHTYDPFEWGARGNFSKFLDLPIIMHEAKGITCDIENIDFAFIDGFHEKEHVVGELDVILPRLTDGALVYFHDTNGSSVTCDVPGGIKEKGLEVEVLKTLNGMMLYKHGKNISDKPVNKTKRSRNNTAKSQEPSV